MRVRIPLRKQQVLIFQHLYLFFTVTAPFISIIVHDNPGYIQFVFKNFSFLTYAGSDSNLTQHTPLRQAIHPTYYKTNPPTGMFLTAEITVQTQFPVKTQR